jgi:hypothetical protein
MADRYLKIVLTIIAIELGWIAVKDTAVTVAAQQAQQNERLTPVVIRGVDIPCDGSANCHETLPIRTSGPIRVVADAPLPVDARGIVRIRTDQPMIVETRERPLLIQSVPAGTAPRPGPGE